MPEAYISFGISDIKSIWVPCSKCETGTAFPPDHGFDSPLEQHVVTKCPNCGSHDGFKGTFHAIRALQALAQQPYLEGADNLLSKVKLELKNGLHGDV